MCLDNWILRFPLRVLLQPRADILNLGTGHIAQLSGFAHFAAVSDCAIKQHLFTNNLIEPKPGINQGHSSPDFIIALVQTWTKELNSR
eukprot:g22863.t1